MAVEVTLKIALDKDIRVFEYKDGGWNDNPCLYSKDVMEILNKFVQEYKKSMDAMGFPQVTNND